MLMVALSLAACHNVYPPSDEMSDKIIDACHDAIGQPYSAFADKMAELGIELTAMLSLKKSVLFLLSENFFVPLQREMKYRILPYDAPTCL